MTAKLNHIEIYCCPKDATPSSEMPIIWQGKEGLRHIKQQFPNEILLCSKCNKPYRWEQLKKIKVNI